MDDLLSYVSILMNTFKQDRPLHSYITLVAIKSCKAFSVLAVHV